MNTGKRAAVHFILWLCLNRYQSNEAVFGVVIGRDGRRNFSGGCFKYP